MSGAENFVEIQIPQQKLFCGFRFPAAMSLSSRTPFSLSQLTQSIKAEKPFLESLLLESGAVLFRGCPVKTASDFNDVVEAFGCEELPYMGGAAPRTNVVGRVFTANESPTEREIFFHHEMALVSVSLLVTFLQHLLST